MPMLGPSLQMYMQGTKNIICTPSIIEGRTLTKHFSKLKLLQKYKLQMENKCNLSGIYNVN
jgi:hypothetical protein